MHRNLILASLLVFHCSAHAVEVTFASATTVVASGGTGGVAVADLDADGSDEFVAQDPLYIWDWNGSSWVGYEIDNGVGKKDRFAGDNEVLDVDNDGDLDLIISNTTNGGNDGSLLWYSNPGTLGGTWTPTTIHTWSGVGATQDGNSIRHTEETVGDIDGDGYVDIVLRDIRYGSWIFFNTGSGGFGTPIYLAHNPREGVELADLDGDGDKDIVLNGIWFETPVDHINGSYTQRAIAGMEDWYPSGTTSTQINDYAAKVRCADFNEDGKIDIVISNSEMLAGSSPTKPRGVRSYLQPADLINDTWTSVVLDADHFSWHNLKVADIDQDGNVDVMAGISDVGVDTEPGNIGYWLGNGDGTFQTFVQIGSDIAYQADLGDYDGDGDLDLFAPNSFTSIGGPIRLYENTTIFAGNVTVGTAIFTNLTIGP